MQGLGSLGPSSKLMEGIRASGEDPKGLRVSVHSNMGVRLIRVS